MNPVILDETLPLTSLQPHDIFTGKYRHDVAMQYLDLSAKIAGTEDRLEKCGLEAQADKMREDYRWSDGPNINTKIKVRRDDGRWIDVWHIHPLLWERLGPELRQGAIVIQTIKDVTGLNERWDEAR